MARKRPLFSIRMRASRAGRHVSGAEGIYAETAAHRIVGQYTERALRHSLGKADEIVVTVQQLTREPRKIRALPVSTIRNTDPRNGRRIVDALLGACGIGVPGIRTAWGFLSRSRTIRGGILLNPDGVRMDPDLERGVRVSRMGIAAAAQKALSRTLAEYGWDTQTVHEALVLASKVHVHPVIMAELCISDDPDYTTGYVASRQHGYVRIPQLKKTGSRRGGRVFFVRGDTKLRELLGYLEQEPVIVASVERCLGFRSVDDIIAKTDT